MIAKGSSIASIQVDKWSLPFVLDRATTASKSQCCTLCLKYAKRDDQACYCHFGCGITYCNVSCRSHHDKNSGHWYSCNGKVNGKSLTMTSDFLHHAKLTNEHFRTSLLIVSKIVANAVQLYGTTDRNIRRVLAKSVSEFLVLFPSPLLACIEDDDDDSEAYADTYESYSLLQALLKYEKTPSAGINVDEWREALTEISFPVYRHIVRLAETSMVPLKLATPLPPLLEELKRIPLLSTFAERRDAVNHLMDLVQAASAFLVPSKNNQATTMIGELNVDPESEVLRIERLAARLAQTADLASTTDSPDNPLSGHVYSAMALIPAAYCKPSDAADEDAAISNVRLRHSCIPNVHLELIYVEHFEYGSTVPVRQEYKVQGIALRNILPGEALTYGYIDCSAGVKTRQSALCEKLHPTGTQNCSNNSGFTRCCGCLKCTYELDSMKYLNDLLNPFLRFNQQSRLQEGVTAFESLVDRLDIHPSSSCVLRVCKTGLSQYLLYEVLQLCRTGDKLHSEQSIALLSSAVVSTLHDAVTLADSYMQDSKVEQALILYCSVLLSHYHYTYASAASSNSRSCSSNSENGSLDESEARDLVIQLIGDVVLSIGNALLDISIQPAETTSVSERDGITTNGTTIDNALLPLVEMITAAPYQLCHKLWKNGAKFIGTLHSGVNTHINDRRNYDFDTASSSSSDVDSRRQSVMDLNNYHQIRVLSSNSGSVKTEPASPAVCLSKRPILSSRDCEYVIQVAEQHAAQHMNGSWTTSRHYAVPTTDIPVQEVPLLLDWFRGIMKDVLEPMLRAQFVPPATATAAEKEGTPCCVSVHDAFVVKYQCDPEEDASGGTPSSRQRYLPLHSDQSTHSLTIALNGTSAYQGGGTYFVDLNAALRPDRGHVLSFRGDLMHGGDPVTSGTRYILAIFLLLKTDHSVVSLREPGDVSGGKRKWLDDSSQSGEGGGGIAQVFKNRQTGVGADGTSASSSAVDSGESEGFSFSFL